MTIWEMISPRSQALEVKALPDSSARNLIILRFVSCGWRGASTGDSGRGEWYWLVVVAL